MGLDLEVGILADLKQHDEDGYQHYLGQFSAVNKCLQSVGLPEHREPGQLADDRIFSCSMGGYSFLHHLRRLAAHLALGKPLPPPSEAEAPEDPVVAAYYAQRAPRQGLLARLLRRTAPGLRFEHLMLHSDAEGFYLPFEFPSVLFPDDALGVAGGMVGSAPRLHAECVELAAVLGIPLELDHESDEMAAALEEPGVSGWQRHGTASFVCLRLIRACEASAASGAAIVFC